MTSRSMGLAGPVLAALILALGGCAGVDDNPPRAESAPQPNVSESPSGGITLPPTTGTFDYQLGGDYTPAKGVTVVTRDSTGAPEKGIYSICYVNGFQTQPGATWPASLIVHTSEGRPLVDPGWPDEHLIDTSSATKRQSAAAMQKKTIRLCAMKGFQAVEFDNLDSWTRSKGVLTRSDAVAFAKLLVTASHEEGMAASQKNATDLARIGKDEIGFDFVTSEECDLFKECDAYAKVYGDHVLDVEYVGNLRDSFPVICARSTTPQQTVLRDRDLVTPGEDGYTYQRC